MQKNIFFTIVFFIFFTNSLSATESSQPLNINKFVFFGDSLTDNGNQVYGEPQIRTFPQEGVTPWSQVLSSKYGYTLKPRGYFDITKTPLIGKWATGIFKIDNDPLRQANGTNYAFAGSLAGNIEQALLQQLQIPPFSQTYQAALYLVDEGIIPRDTSKDDIPQAVINSTKKLNKNAYHSFWTGSNNLIKSYNGNLNEDQKKTLRNIVPDICKALQLIKAAGGDNFIIFKLPDFSIVPFTQDDYLLKPANDISIADLGKQTNEDLSKKLEEDGVNALLIDIPALLRHLYDNFKNYKFNNTDGIFYTDGLHISDKTNAILAETVNAFLQIQSIQFNLLDNTFNLNMQNASQWNSYLSISDDNKAIIQGRYNHGSANLLYGYQHSVTSNINSALAFNISNSDVQNGNLGEYGLNQYTLHSSLLWSNRTTLDLSANIGIGWNDFNNIKRYINLPYTEKEIQHSKTTGFHTYVKLSGCYNIIKSSTMKVSIIKTASFQNLDIKGRNETSKYDCFSASIKDSQLRKYNLKVGINVEFKISDKFKLISKFSTDKSFGPKEQEIRFTPLTEKNVVAKFSMPFKYDFNYEIENNISYNIGQKTKLSIGVSNRCISNNWQHNLLMQIILLR